MGKEGGEREREKTGETELWTEEEAVREKGENREQKGGRERKRGEEKEQWGREETENGKRKGERAWVLQNTTLLRQFEVELGRFTK